MLSTCADWAAERIKTVMRQQHLQYAFIATDLRSGSSGTYEVGDAQTDALQKLEVKVPQLRNTELHAFIDAIPDTGVRSNVEATICAKASMLLATTNHVLNSGKARQCSKTTSAFAQYIVQRRKAFLRPTGPLF
jgi:hypothetical protein